MYIQLTYAHSYDGSFNRVRGWVMVFNATFNNISVISLVVSFIGGGNRQLNQSKRNVFSL
jgi:hypothetical protein